MNRTKCFLVDVRCMFVCIFSVWPASDQSCYRRVAPALPTTCPRQLTAQLLPHYFVMRTTYTLSIYCLLISQGPPHSTAISWSATPCTCFLSYLRTFIIFWVICIVEVVILMFTQQNNLLDRDQCF